MVAWAMGQGRETLGETAFEAAYAAGRAGLG